MMGIKTKNNIDCRNGTKDYVRDKYRQIGKSKGFFTFGSHSVDKFFAGYDTEEGEKIYRPNRDA